MTTPPDRRSEPPTASGGQSVTDADEVARLRTEIAGLKSQLEQSKMEQPDRDRGARRRGIALQVRRMAAALLIMVSALSITASLVAVWSARTVMDTDRWVATVGPLPEDPRVTAAIAEYTTTQVFDGLDIQGRLTAALPSQAAILVGPVTAQLRNYVRQTVDKVLQNDRFQEVWVTANRLAHEQIVAILRGESEFVSVEGQEVHIDLLPVVNEVLRQLEAELPTLFGRQLNLPDINSGEIPANLRTIIENALGVTLPANFAQFTIYRGDELAQLQDAVVTARRSVIALVVFAFVTLALALWASPNRRRTLLQLGLWLVIWVVVVTASIRTVKTQVLAQVPEGTYRAGAEAAVTTIFASLRDRGLLLLWLGVALAVVTYLCGPGRFPRWLRREVVRGGRYAGTWLRRGGARAVADGPTWAHDHLDVLRVAGVIVAVIVALLLASWTSLLVVAIVLAVYELLVTLVARVGARRAPLVEATAE